MLMNATKSLSSDVLYSEIIEWIENSPFFKKYLNPKKDTLFVKKIDIGFGSRGKDALGMATPGAIFSEINDMTVVHGQAEDNFDTIYTRANSRFGGKGKEMIGHLILDSSNKGNKSFIDTRIEEKQNKGVKDFIVFRFAHWEAKMHLGHYSGEYFKVYCGDENRDPFVVDEETDSKVMRGLREERLIDVPVEHRQEFHFNIIKSIRDLAGVSTFGTWSFITSQEVLNRAFDHINPVTQKTIVLDFFDKKQKLLDFLDVEMLKNYSNKPRFIHVDLGLKNDSTGISCSFVTDYVTKEILDTNTGRTQKIKSPVYFTEWCMEIRPVPGHEVPIYKIKEFFLEARNMGYNIACVSTDGYQSTNLRQDLTLAGIESELISVDRTKDPYNYFRNCILEERASLPRSDKLRDEIAELEEHEKGFDHPADGSKDVLDSTCGSVWNAKINIDRVGHMISEDELMDSLDKTLDLYGRENYLENYLNRGRYGN